MLKCFDIEPSSGTGSPCGAAGDQHVPESRGISCGAWEPTAHAHNGNWLTWFIAAIFGGPIWVISTHGAVHARAIRRGTVSDPVMHVGRGY